MIYSNFGDLQLSALGMGCMRLPGDGAAHIDREATREMVDYAISHGINYFDTAWGYHHGESERVMGEILSAYPRESYYLATKFPGFDKKTVEKVEEIFEKQLEKCKVEYFDFYLFHNVCEINIDWYLDPQYGILDYLLKQKENGRIRHLGFSTHGNLETMKRFLDAYGKHMEFCQIQLNWLDYSFQHADQKMKLIAAHGLPIWVMEPLRGGSLATVEAEHMEKLMQHNPAAKAPEWGFRFLQSLPEVTVTLSGMSNFEQLKENIATYEEYKPLTSAEMGTLLEIAQAKTAKNTVPCTACRYCTAYCVRGLNIPWFIELYNEHLYSGKPFRTPEAVFTLPEEKRPTICLGCRACEQACPQNIQIADIIMDFGRKMRQ